MRSRRWIVFLDDRLFRTPRWHLRPPKDWTMLVPRDLLQTVVFLGQERGSGVHIGGTAYFVGVPGPTISDKRWLYLVTAAHCVEGRTGLVARLNHPDGGTMDVRLPDGDEWTRHPGPAP